MGEEEKILEFGIKRENSKRRDGGCCIVFDPKTKKYAVYKHPKSNALCLFGGGFNEGENEKDGCLRELFEESGLFDFLHTEKIDQVICHYFNRNKEVYVMANATCFLVILNSTKRENPKFENHENNFEFTWATGDEILNSWKTGNQDRDYDHWIYFFEKSQEKLKKLGHI
jgi:ADP-ribose pyrophosphatase YjhB (NUDIX family)